MFAFENILINKEILTFLAHSKRRILNLFKSSPKRLAFEDTSTIFSDSKFTLQKSDVGKEIEEIVDKKNNKKKILAVPQIQ